MAFLQSIDIKCGEIYYTNQQFKFRCLLCECDLDIIDSDSNNSFNFIKHYDMHFEEERLDEEITQKEVSSEIFNFSSEYLEEISECIDEEEFSQEDDTSKPETLSQSLDVIVDDTNLDKVEEHHINQNIIQNLLQNRKKKMLCKPEILSQTLEVKREYIFEDESDPLAKISEYIKEEEFLQEDEISKPEFLSQSMKVNTVENLKKGITQIKVPFIPKSFDDKYHCSYNDCGKSFDNEKLIQHHIRNIHILDIQMENEKFQCPICDSSFTRKHAASTHLLKIHEIASSVEIKQSPIDSKYHCPVCMQSCCKLHSINRHLKYQHESYYNELLEKQQNNVSEQKIVVDNTNQNLPRNRKKKTLCEICGKELQSYTSAMRHKLTHTGKKPYKCDFCGKAFACSTNCKTHMRIHTSERRYACSYCDKRYNTSTDKKMHELVQHIKEKRFECFVCNRKFFKQFDLTRHTRRHTGDRPYKCEICEKSFYEGSLLKDHMISHVKTKNYQCDICKAVFPRQKSLRAHKQTHSSIKKYHCEICGRRFAQCAGLYSHKKTHHKHLIIKKEI